MSPAWFACREPQHDNLLPEQEVTHLSQGVEAAAASGQSAAMCHLARNAQEVHHQVRVCGHAWALDPASAASVTHSGWCPYPSWGNGIEKKPAVKQNCCLVAQSCLIHCNPMDCSLPGFSVHGILQARILEWVAMPSSRRSSPPREPPRKVGKDTALLWNQPEAERGPMD